MPLKYEFPLWYYIGNGILEGKIVEPFGPNVAKELVERLGLHYASSTFEAYFYKHSINSRDKVIKVFIRTAPNLFRLDRKCFENACNY